GLLVPLRFLDGDVSLTVNIDGNRPACISRRAIVSGWSSTKLCLTFPDHRLVHAGTKEPLLDGDMANAMKHLSCAVKPVDDSVGGDADGLFEIGNLGRDSKLRLCRTQRACQESERSQQTGQQSSDSAVAGHGSPCVPRACRTDFPSVRTDETAVL